MCRILGLFFKVNAEPILVKNTFSAFLYGSDPTKEHFSDGANITKM